MDVFVVWFLFMTYLTKVEDISNSNKTIIVCSTIRRPGLK